MRIMAAPFPARAKLTIFGLLNLLREQVVRFHSNKKYLKHSQCLTQKLREFTLLRVFNLHVISWGSRLCVGIIDINGVN